MGELSVIAEKKEVLFARNGCKSTPKTITCLTGKSKQADEKRRRLEQMRLKKIPDVTETLSTQMTMGKKDVSLPSEEKQNEVKSQHKDVSSEIVTTYDIRTSMRSFGSDIDWTLLDDFEWKQQKSYSNLSEYSLDRSLGKEPWFRKYNIDQLRREYIWLKNLCSRPVKEICSLPVSDPDAPQNSYSVIRLKSRSSSHKRSTGNHEGSIITEEKPVNYRNSFLYISGYKHSGHDQRQVSEFTVDMERERIRLPRLTKNKTSLVSSNALKGEYERKGRHRHRSQDNHGPSIPMIYPKALSSITLPRAPPSTPVEYEWRHTYADGVKNSPRNSSFLRPIQETKHGKDYNCWLRLQKLPRISNRKRKEKITVRLPVCDQHEQENNDNGSRRLDEHGTCSRSGERNNWSGKTDQRSRQSDGTQDGDGSIPSISSDELLRYNVYNPSKEDLGDDSLDGDRSDYNRTTEQNGRQGRIGIIDDSRKS
jgi:hypothetical protein